MDALIRDLRLLWKADSLIGKIWLNVMVRRFGLFLFAGLIAVFGLGMTNVAGFYALQGSVGSVWAAATVSVADFVLASMVMLAGKRSAPGPELNLILEVRKTAIESFQADARDLQVTLDALRQEVRETKDTIARFVHNPLDEAVQKLLVPAAVSIVKGLRSRKDRGPEKGP
ncbi:MAG TPA: hypothetical protein VLU73_04540 [Methylococcaceae bacterium]|jgi:hypothetical protein|nr:hypothetical protein [Methylococcaceae bacterium]